jgi:hypothetical protein
VEFVVDAVVAFFSYSPSAKGVGMWSVCFWLLHVVAALVFNICGATVFSFGHACECLVPRFAVLYSLCAERIQITSKKGHCLFPVSTTWVNERWRRPEGRNLFGFADDWHFVSLVCIFFLR